MTVHWTESALADLQAIFAYTARHSPRYAQALVERMFGHTELLSEHPLLGSIVSEIDDKSLRQLLETPYRIVYRVLPNQVDVVAVIHAARQAPPAP